MPSSKMHKIVMTVRKTSWVEIYRIEMQRLIPMGEEIKRLLLFSKNMISLRVELHIVEKIVRG